MHICELLIRVKTPQGYRDRVLLERMRKQEWIGQKDSAGQDFCESGIRGTNMEAMGDRFVQKVAAIKISARQCGTRVSVSISMVQLM